MSKPNIKLIVQDEQARAQFSEVTENILSTASASENDVESLNNNIVEALKVATNQAIETRTVAKKPWANTHFLSLLDEQKACATPERKKELKNEIKKVGKRLKNQYYSEKANELNLASESKDTEEEFRLMKNYSMLKKKHQTPISATKLEEHFRNHFKERQIDIPDEVMNPQNYQHLACPQELYSIRVNEEPPKEKKF